MAVSEEDVVGIARLARLAVSPDDMPLYADRLTRVLDLAGQLESVDTEGLLPMAHPMDDAVQRLREDRVSEPDQREAFQSQAPAVERGLYLVPRVVE